MTDFRRVRCLHAYSGGTVPDSNRVHYSPPIPGEIGGTQMQCLIVIIIHALNTRVNILSYIDLIKVMLESKITPIG